MPYELQCVGGIVVVLGGGVLGAAEGVLGAADGVPVTLRPAAPVGAHEPLPVVEVLGDVLGVALVLPRAPEPGIEGSVLPVVLLLVGAVVVPAVTEGRQLAGIAPDGVVPMGGVPAGVPGVIVAPAGAVPVGGVVPSGGAVPTGGVLVIGPGLAGAVFVGGGLMVTGAVPVCVPAGGGVGAVV